MNRRKFIYGVVTGTAGVGLARRARTITGPRFTENRAVTFHVAGFSCVTCAIGLEVTLLKQKGVSFAKATYPEGGVVIRFDERQVSERDLKETILDCGFSAEAQHSTRL